MPGVRRDPSAMPMLSGADTEWFPTLGVSWQVEQVAVATGLPSASLSPPTPLTLNVLVLKMASPRATDARAAVVVFDPFRPDHELKIVNALGSNAAPVGFWPRGSLMPT